METETPRRENPRKGRRWRCHGGVLGAGSSQPVPLPPRSHRNLFLLLRRRHHAHTEGNDRRNAWRLRRASARRSARVRERIIPYAVIPRALWRRHARASLRLARQYGVEAVAEGRRILPAQSARYILNRRLALPLNILALSSSDSGMPAIHSTAGLLSCTNGQSTANSMWSTPISITQHSSAGLEKKPLVVT